MFNRMFNGAKLEFNTFRAFEMYFLNNHYVLVVRMLSGTFTRGVELSPPPTHIFCCFGSADSALHRILPVGNAPFPEGDSVQFCVC